MDTPTVVTCGASIRKAISDLTGTTLEQCERELWRCADAVGAMGSYAKVELGHDGGWTAYGTCVSLMGDPMVFVASRPYATKAGAEKELLHRLKMALR
jgi:hypothetical protein